MTIDFVPRNGWGPTPEVAQDLHRKLKTLDPLLGILWVPGAVYLEGRDRHEGRYAITCRWADVDRRWEMYRRGEIGEPFDILGWVTDAIGRQTPDFHETEAAPISLEMVEEKVLEFLGRVDLSRQDGGWKGRMKANMEANQRRREAVRKEMVDESVDRLLHFRGKLGNIQQEVVGVDLQTETPKEG